MRQRPTVSDLLSSNPTYRAAVLLNAGEHPRKRERPPELLVQGPSVSKGS